MWLQLGGSLAAVLTLAGIAWMLKLGGGRIADAAEAMGAAEQILSGFEARSALVGSDGQAALVHGRDGSVAVLKMHGARIAARRLQPPLRTETAPGGLRIVTGETRFGSVLIRGATEAAGA